MPRKTFTVIYRTGGTLRCQWHKTTPVATRDEAIARKREIERMGYKALIHDTDALTAIGMPVGWTAADTELPADFWAD